MNATTAPTNLLPFSLGIGPVFSGETCFHSLSTVPSSSTWNPLFPARNAWKISTTLPQANDVPSARVWMNQVMHALFPRRSSNSVHTPRCEGQAGLQNVQRPFEVNSVNGFGGRVEKQTKFVLAFRAVPSSASLRSVMSATIPIIRSSLFLARRRRLVPLFSNQANRTIRTQYAIANAGSLSSSGVSWSTETDKQCCVRLDGLLATSLLDE